MQAATGTASSVTEQDGGRGRARAGEWQGPSVAAKRRTQSGDRKTRRPHCDVAQTRGSASDRPAVFILPDKGLFFLIIGGCCSAVRSGLTLFTPWMAARQAPLSLNTSQSLLKPMSLESAMPSSHLILCRPLLFAFNFSSIRAFPRSWLKTGYMSRAGSGGRRHSVSGACSTRGGCGRLASGATHVLWQPPHYLTHTWAHLSKGVGISEVF